MGVSPIGSLVGHQRVFDACCSGQTRQSGGCLESGVHRMHQALAIPETVMLRNECPGFFFPQRWRVGSSQGPGRQSLKKLDFSGLSSDFLSPDFTLETLTPSSAEERRNEEDGSGPVSLVPDTLIAQSVLATAQHDMGTEDKASFQLGGR